MLSDPQSLTLATVAQTCPAISRENLKSLYRKADGTVEFSVSHQRTKGARLRHLVRVDVRYVAPDPFTAENREYSVGAYIVIDRPEVGLTPTQIRNVAEALVDWSSDSNLDKVLSLES